MKWLTFVQRFIDTVEIEYDRRIRLASEVKEYRIGSKIISLLEQPPKTQLTDQGTVHMAGNMQRIWSYYKYVFILVITYLILSIGTYFLLSITIEPDPSNETASRVAYDVATGGSPITYYKDLKNWPWLWSWILVFHVLSWLVLPLLVAVAVDIAFRLRDERRLALERRIRLQVWDLAQLYQIPFEEAQIIYDREREAEERR